MDEQGNTDHAATIPVFSSPDIPSLLEPDPDQETKLGSWCQLILLRYMQDLLAQREVVWRNEQVEGVHQIRVAARRLRTALQTFGSLWEPQLVKRHTKYLARFADTFGVARDLDVMIIYLEAQLHGAHRDRRQALQWMLERKRRLRAQQQPKLEEALLKFEEEGYAAEFVDYFAGNPFPIETEGAPQ